jgi:hypothetical protein
MDAKVTISTLRIFIISFCICCIALTVFYLLYGAYSAFTWGKYTLFDYGVYTNMIWNSAHGEWFKVLIDRSYLETHLSFSLAIIGLLFFIWDDPFLLAFVQWALLLAGGLILFAVARRHGVRGELTAALLLFFFGYPFTQSVLLSEFHGIALYYFLVPWLYAGLKIRKQWVWLPLILILGVREDAFLFILPMIFYFAVKGRWRTGYALAVVAVLYGLLAMFVLYPSINDVSLFERRSREIGLSGVINQEGRSLKFRYEAIVWAVLPVFVVLGRKLTPAWWFPSVALLTVLLSGFWRQQELRNHYPAPLMVCLAIGLLEVFILRAATHDKSTSRTEVTTLFYACVLVVMTLVAHACTGFLPLGGQHRREYSRPKLSGRIAYHMARRIPKEGLLVSDNRLIGFCCNRSEVLPWKLFSRDQHQFDVVFTTLNTIHLPQQGTVMDMLEKESFGLRHFDGNFVIVQRGYDPSRNREFLEDHRNGLIVFAWTHCQGGETLYSPSKGVTRHWNGNASRGHVLLSYGAHRRLQPGSYEAVFRYRARKPERIEYASWGRFTLHEHGSRNMIAQSEIPLVESLGDEMLAQRVPFSIDQSTDIEVKVMGADAALWLDSVTFVSESNTTP